MCALSVVGCFTDPPTVSSTDSGSDTGPETTTTTSTSTTAAVDDSSGSTAGGGTTQSETSAADTTSGDSSGEPTTTGISEGPCADPDTATYPGTQGELDVLFVVDNSSGMGFVQANLGAAMDSLVARLDNEGLDYRIGVTTSDVGNPWCVASTPEAGTFVASTCRQRLSEFQFLGDPGIDVREEACTDICPHQTIPLLPTPTELDATPQVRPWIERIDGTTNLPEGVTPGEALRCIVPQGIDGCGFERTLEGMRMALLRAQINGEPNYGFLRSSADLLVVLVTDEYDCSSDPDADTIFLPDGNRVFWEDPFTIGPSSSVCWNAGVECTGGPGIYDECHAQNYDVDGNPSTPQDAVLHDLARYTDVLADIDADNGPASVHLAVMAGFPATGDIIYADARNPDEQLDFGIGPGCTGDGIVAYPPVRLREVAEAAALPGIDNEYSVCEPMLCESFESMIDGVVD